jgi:hypothetical protein
MGALIGSPATEDDRAAFLASVDGLFHDDAGVHDPCFYARHGFVPASITLRATL